MDPLRIDRLYRITENKSEQFIYALLSEEDAEINGKPDGDVIELYLILPSGMDALAREFLSEKLGDLGWEIYVDD